MSTDSTAWVAGLTIGDRFPAVLIAEVASSHEGRPDLALQLLERSVEAGAQFVKFQLLRSDDLLTPDHPKYSAFQIIQLQASAWESIAAAGERLGARLIAEVFDEASFHLAEGLPFAAYKVHSTDLANPRMLDAVGASTKAVFVSTGGTTFAEVDTALARLRAAGARDLVLLHGFQSFPTKIEDSNLRQIGALRARFGLPVGYADHVDGGSPMAFHLPLMALAAGARVIEKHVTPDRSKKGRDYYSALNPDELATMAALIKQADSALGREDDALSSAEMDYRGMMKKAAVASRPLAAGTRLAPEHLAFKRAPKPGLSPVDALACCGRTLTVALEANDVIAFDHFSSGTGQ